MPLPLHLLAGPNYSWLNKAKNKVLSDALTEVLTLELSIRHFNILQKACGHHSLLMAFAIVRIP
jgi:hypothetical protein